MTPYEDLDPSTKHKLLAAIHYTRDQTTLSIHPTMIKATGKPIIRTIAQWLEYTDNTLTSLPEALETSREELQILNNSTTVIAAPVSAFLRSGIDFSPSRTFYSIED